MRPPLLVLVLVLLTLATTTGDDALYQQGVKALKDRKADEAIHLLQAAVDADPRCVDCRWELGWAYYLKARWPQVVEQWREVKRLDPRHPEVDRHLPGAEALLDAEQRAARAASSAPASTSRPATETRLRLRDRKSVV